MKLRVPTNAGLVKLLLSPLGRVLVAGLAIFTILSVGVFTYYYAKYAKVIDQKLQVGPFANAAKIYASPETVAVGDTLTPEDIAASLRRSGYNESRGNPVGYYQLHINSIEVFPGTDSYFDQEAGLIRFSGGRISQIISLQDNTQRNEYQLEPQLITNISGPNREKRRMVKFADIPRVLVEAVTSAEDKRFFQHNGFDPLRVIKAAYVDLKTGRKEQGASTLSMQLARDLWLDQGKRWTRKLAEMVITLEIEQRLSKQEIFEDYANDVYLGSRGSFRIHGFGEASEAYLGKDLSQITLPEAAELAGMIQQPGYFDPFRHPDRLKERRNLVLSLMRQNGYIQDREYALATDVPLTVAKNTAQSLEAPYFVDLVNDTVQSKFGDTDLQNNALRIYTSLDLRLQRAAAEAIRLGMDNVDQQIRKQKRYRGQTVPEAQVALIAIDPHTGEIKALSGGRNYGMSQLDHVLAFRQPGSIFKPFVYAAAMNTGVEGGSHIFTPSTMVVDEPTTFYYEHGTREYKPSNFEHKFYGQVTLRQALAHSLNVATVKVGEMVGFDDVVSMANRAGMNYHIQPTPAVALGSYDITPIEAAGAYTMFANQGVYVKPSFITMVRSASTPEGQESKVIYKNQAEQKQVLDPRVAYLMTSMMEEVLRSGTAAGVRAKYNLNFPAAGKTGTSHDGWFAGYTSELLCVVWVGFDNNDELDLEGAHSAAPIWAEFMKRAVGYREYRDTKPFRAPDGIVTLTIDPQSGYPATPNCPKTQEEVYIAGTEPTGSCPLHGGRQVITNVAGWDVSPQTGPAAGGPTPAAAPSGVDGQLAPGAVASRAARQNPPAAQKQPSTNPSPGLPATQVANSPSKPDANKGEQKKGLLRRLLNVFK
ncbi:MAG TPA: PBP1A family penicillin-binding protein [Bryobacteraceae bacterium]|nr:PBP1A family penicillin-binding protein [Bryobacteraceae bacterium]